MEKTATLKFCVKGAAFYGVCGAVIGATFYVVIAAVMITVAPGTSVTDIDTISTVLTAGAVGAVTGFLLGGIIGGTLTYVHVKYGEWISAVCVIIFCVGCNCLPFLHQSNYFLPPIG